MDNIIITENVLKNMPNTEDMFSRENAEYFDKLYADFIVNASKWFEEDERA